MKGRILLKNGIKRPEFNLVKPFTLLLLSILLILTSLVPALPVLADTPAWTIDGDKVYVDDENVYLSATPHTLKGSGWVEFELISKNYEGEVDAVWGFETSAGVVPENPQIWADNVAHEEERWVDVEKSGEMTLDNILSYEILALGSIEPDIGNLNNTKLIQLELEGIDSDNEWSTWYLVVAYNTVVQHSSTAATFYYNYTVGEKEYYTEYYPDFRPLNISNFTKVNYDYLGVNTWYYIRTDNPIQKDTTYKLRVWVDVPFTGLDEFTTKYVWGVKPTGESISEAKNNGHLYLLDPWLVGGWKYRVKFTVDSGDIDAALGNFPVLAYLSTSSGIGNDDISFVFDELQNDANRKKIAVTTSDGETECYVEIEKWDDANEQAWLWIKAPAIASGTDTDFYLYFDVDHADNDAYVGDTNDVVAENVWDGNFALVDHMQDGASNASTYDSTANDNDGTKGAAGAPTEIGGKIGDAEDFDGNDYIDITVVLGEVAATTKGAHSIILKVADATPAASYRLISFGDTNAAEWIDFHLNTDGRVRAYGVSASAGDWALTTTNPVISDNTYAQIDLVHNGTLPTLYIDGVAVAQSFTLETDKATWFSACAGIDNSFIGKLSMNSNPNQSFLTGIADEVRVSDDDRTAAWVKASYETAWDDLLTWGGEEAGAPVVDTDNAEVDSLTATLEGDITSVGSIGSVSERGFVWDTVTHADPGNVAPPATYANSWTETGTFTTGIYNHEITGLTELTTYYYRACVYNPASWVYGEEITFFIGEEGKVYLELRPDLAETKIRAQLGVPSDIFVGEFNGYSLPIFASDNECLNYIICVPDSWDGASGILMRIDCALSVGNEADRSYKWEVLWEHYTSNEDIVPATSNTIYNERYIHSNNQYQSYQDWLILDYDIDVADPILADDLIALTLRRVTVGQQQTDANEIYVFAIDILFARGDFLADPVGNIIIIIDGWMEENMEEIGIQFAVFNGILAGRATYFLIGFGLMVLAFFSFFAFWRWSAVLFMLAAGVAVMLGFFWYDGFKTNLGLGISLMLFCYTFLCIGFAFRCIFWRPPREKSNED